jgi:hypothetical protein|tara:strand:- start:646 stop:879 length:234 start_codon:yes stop_codon:yes gene_type:complete
MNKEKIFELVLGQGGALVLACIALWYISQLYVDQIDGMMVRCDDDRKMYQEHMLRLSEKLDVMSEDIKDIKDAQVDK